MELESVQLETVWNDAANVINANNQKIKTEIEKIKGYFSEGGYGEMNVQSDWNETDETSDAYIKNKPTIPSGSNIYIAKTTLSDLEDAYRQGTDYYFPEEDLQAFADSMKNGTTVLFPDPFGMGTEYQYRGYGMLVAAAVEDLLYLSIADQYGKIWGLDVVWGEYDNVANYGKLYSMSQRYVDYNSLKTINGQPIYGSGNIEIGSNIYIAKTTMNELIYGYQQGTFSKIPQEDIQAINSAMGNGTLVLFPDPLDMGDSYQYRGYGMMLYAAAEDMLYLQVSDGVYIWSIEVIWTPEGIAENEGEITNVYEVYQHALISGGNIKTINNQSLLGSGNIETAKKPYTIQSLKIEDISVGESFENEIEYIKDAIRNGADIEIRAFAGGKSKAIFQDLDDFVYLSFPRANDIIFLEVAPDSGDITAGYATTSTPM